MFKVLHIICVFKYNFKVKNTAITRIDEYAFINVPENRYKIRFYFYHDLSTLDKRSKNRVIVC